jgi:hypothetical protein
LSAQSSSEFYLTLRDGSLLRTSLQMPAVRWRRIGPNGNVTTDTLDFESVARVDLARSPASRQLIEIRQLLVELQSDNYHVRNQAEATLILRGGAFVDILTAASETDNAEVRYRIGRILKRLQAKDAKRIDAEYDRVQLMSGEIVSGDLEFDTLSAEYRGRSYEWPRQAIDSISRSGPPAAGEIPAGAATFTSPDAPFFARGDVHITFDAGRLNESFGKFEDIRNAFVFRGTLFTSDCGAVPASVVTAGFAIDKGRSKRNSAANMTRNEEKSKYIGAIRIDFCEPGLADIPAAVHRVGCFIALVDHPRDFELVAYSAEGQIVATAEALEKSAFMGVESRIPIAAVRVQPNRNLNIDPEEQDKNFVIDDLTFDPPTAVIGVARTDQARLWTTDGSRLVCSSVSFDGRDFRATSASLPGDGASETSLVLAPESVGAICFPASEPTERAPGLWGYFADGSQLPLSADGEGLVSAAFAGWNIARNELAGVWGSRGELRYPLQSDLDGGKTVIVRPAERWLVDQVQIGGDGVRWDGASAELREVFTLENSSHAPDPTTSFALADAPSIWWQAPVAPGETGWLLARDGRKFVFNGPTQFALDRLDESGAWLSRGEQKFQIPWDEIAAIEFPEQP